AIASFTFLFSLLRRAARSTLFPYTTLFRSVFVEGTAQSAVAAASATDRGRPHRADRRRGRHDQDGWQQRGVRLQSARWGRPRSVDRKSTRLNSSHVSISYAVFCLKKTITRL